MLTLRVLVPKHSGFEIAYSEFNRLRTKLAKEIGMDLRSMEGFDGDGKFSEWQDDLLPLLDHADNEGQLSVDDCAIVYPRILSVIENWEDDKDKQTAYELAMVLKDCAEEGRSLLFD
ncbi:hypothetical protein ACFVS2_25095 [Brevibacillus sp. NPDC058079]|uniref:hypothetical protein n=1 Tax=Brevibacillus sp. NPDC058079 TaxID=3346330 RepID=UPI0036F18EC1